MCLQRWTLGLHEQRRKQQTNESVTFAFPIFQHVTGTRNNGEGLANLWDSRTGWRGRPWRCWPPRLQEWYWLLLSWACSAASCRPWWPSCGQPSSSWTKAQVFLVKMHSPPMNKQHMRQDLWASQETVPADGALPAGADGAGHLHEPLLVHLRTQPMSPTPQEARIYRESESVLLRPVIGVDWTDPNSKPFTSENHGNLPIWYDDVGVRNGRKKTDLGGGGRRGAGDVAWAGRMEERMGGGGGARWAQVLGEDDYRVCNFPYKSLGFLCFMYVGAWRFRWAGPLEASGLISMQKPREKRFSDGFISVGWTKNWKLTPYVIINSS